MKYVNFFIITVVLSHYTVQSINSINQQKQKLNLYCYFNMLSINSFCAIVNTSNHRDSLRLCSSLQLHPRTYATAGLSSDVSEFPAVRWSSTFTRSGSGLDLTSRPSCEFSDRPGSRLKVGKTLFSFQFEIVPCWISVMKSGFRSWNFSVSTCFPYKVTVNL